MGNMLVLRSLRGSEQQTSSEAEYDDITTTA